MWLDHTLPRYVSRHCQRPCVLQEWCLTRMTAHHNCSSHYHGNYLPKHLHEGYACVGSQLESVTEEKTWTSRVFGLHYICSSEEAEWGLLEVSSLSAWYLSHMSVLSTLGVHLKTPVTPFLKWPETHRTMWPKRVQILSSWQSIVRKSSGKRVSPAAWMPTPELTRDTRDNWRENSVSSLAGEWTAHGWSSCDLSLGLNNYLC